MTPDSERNAYVELEIFKVEPESEIISSFYLRRVDGIVRPVDCRTVSPDPRDDSGETKPALRTYVLSPAPNPR